MKVDDTMLSQRGDGHGGWESDRLGTARKTKTARRLRIVAMRPSFAC